MGLIMRLGDVYETRGDSLAKGCLSRKIIIIVAPGQAKASTIFEIKVNVSIFLA
ncbi:hypothetical protein D3C77_622300 [compost metagenome]